MKKILYIISLIFIATICACTKEDLPSNSGKDEYGYSVPQGDNEYDTRIVNHFKNYNTYILYKYTERDLFWNINSTLKAYISSGAWTKGFLVGDHDEKYVGELLNFIEQYWFKYYPSEFLKNNLPLKILLTDKIVSVISSGKQTPTYCFKGYDLMAIDCCSERIETLSANELNAFKTFVNYTFMLRILEKGVVAKSEEFSQVTKYNETITKDNMYEKGIINLSRKSLGWDYECFLETIITYPLSYLEEEETPINTLSMKGILHPSKDKKKLIRKKYDLMISHYKELYGVDLQAIGNDKITKLL